MIWNNVVSYLNRCKLGQEYFFTDGSDIDIAEGLFDLTASTDPIVAQLQKELAAVKEQIQCLQDSAVLKNQATRRAKAKADVLEKENEELKRRIGKFLISFTVYFSSWTL